MHLCEWKLLNSKQNFIGIYSAGCISHQVSIGSSNGLALIRHQVIIWTNVDKYVYHHMASLQHNEFINSLRPSDAYMRQQSRSSLVQIMACRLNQCWNFVNWTLRNKLQWNFNKNSNIFIQENVFESVVCEMAAILSLPQWVKHIEAWCCHLILFCSSHYLNQFLPINKVFRIYLTAFSVVIHVYEKLSLSHKICLKMLF